MVNEDSIEEKGSLQPEEKGFAVKHDSAEPVTEEIEIKGTPSLDESQKFVLPGDIIGTSEEFISGKNTFKKGGEIFSTATGLVKINSKTHNISVIPKTDVPPEIEKGDLIIGRVNDLKSSVALVEIARIEGKGEREIVNLQNAAIHVSNIKDSYVKDVMYEFSPFDIIKAKVIDLKTMRLSTSGKNLGVIKAYCGKCHLAMNKISDNGDKSNKLKCPACGNIESRKLSSEYGVSVV